MQNISRSTPPSNPMLEQARQHRPHILETPWEFETWERLYSELAYKLFHALAEQGRRDPRAHQITWVGQLTEADWADIEHHTLSPMAAALLQKAEEDGKAAEQRYLHHVGQRCQVWVNQGLRDAEVLAIIGDRALIKYTMPAGTTALRIVLREDPEVLVRRVSYQDLPLCWRREIEATGKEPVNNPQQVMRRGRA